MALKRLTTEEMVELSSPWITAKSPARKALDDVPELAGMVSKIERVRQGLHDAQPAQADPRLSAIITEQAALDLQHDTLIRGVHMVLTANALLASVDAASELLTVRDLVLPDGLEHTQKTYRGQAGAAKLLKPKLDVEAKKQLKAVRVLEHTALTFVERWIDKAQRLGELEDERASLEPAGGDGTKLVVARNQWIRTINALVANAELAELDEATDRLIFGALRLAEKKADRRAATAGPDAGAGEVTPVDIVKPV